ncbi:SDR family NAD(P)-dependent oxidoreductase [Microlunatus antarcticus]|uniref:Meso-butanediol dehydrogenase/(S,S)-butanediol dehydrogenase/diacetyl reductase n=1 Tax=Microlunatus antarcticus TaxID=53388 RepID=A0A7W5JUY9_9ACTN|nr:meso-butanediol dehydrogenase/(S,S)-butanediol dehydrogenase/diacetyl reductase [Microlunatus antarcticus]
MTTTRFVDQVVVVTGAGRGLGLGIASRFAGEGASVVLLDRDAGVVEVAAELDGRSAGAVHGAVCDVTDEAQVAACFADVDDRHGRVDVLVNNAGTITISTFEELTLEAWNQVLSVNTTGAFLCAKAALPLLRRSASGRILNAASGQARQGFIYTPHYAASKFGVVGLTQSLAKELAKDGITVNAYCPGIVDTDMWDYNDREWGRLLGDYAPGELMAEWVAAIPLGRAGTSDDVADLLLFLASRQAGYITGQSINVDGGMFMS